MPKEPQNMGGPTHNPKEEPTSDRNHRHPESRDEMSERAVHGARPGKGRRNGSSKKK
jgi:hypothetical protein